MAAIPPVQPFVPIPPVVPPLMAGRGRGRGRGRGAQIQEPPLPPVEPQIPHIPIPMITKNHPTIRQETVRVGLLGEG
jgi:hypothetical protein